MDKVTSIAFILFHATDDPDVKTKAVDLLNGETDLRELRSDPDIVNLLETAEAALKKQSVNKEEIQKFVEQYLFVEA
ncbi:hypothetical protein [Neobacillus sp. YIM B06451]|uniref:hypothetical protein n=1 Tax=Neobacillus sp. YIM B06451 TaxID=3070994 RepID=UPI00292FD202|nr:hypothetical protein [Neobacillus sp. YIM B06451]